MITDSYSKMMSDIGMRSMLGCGGGDKDTEEELGLMMRERQLRLQKASDRERELSILRSGSAPPNVERLLGAIGGGGAVVDDVSNSILEEEIRSDPAHISYYYSNANMNPRLPPPLLSKEDWRLAQRIQGGGGGAGAGGGSSVAVGGTGDGRKVSRGNGGGGGENGSSDGSLFSMQPAFGLPVAKEENGKEARNHWGGDGLIGLPSSGIGSRRKSFAEIIQDDKSHSSVSTPPSRSASCVFDSVVESSESQFTHLHELASVDASRAGASVQGMSTIQNAGSSTSHTYASVLGDSLPRSNTPDPQLGAKAPSPRIRRVSSTERRNVKVPNSFHVVQPETGQHADLVSALSGMSLSGVNSMLDGSKHLRSRAHHEMDELLHMQGDHTATNRHSYLNKSVNSYLNGPSTPTLGSASSPPCYSNVGCLNSSFPNYGLAGYAFNPSSPSALANRLDGGNLPPLLENIATAMAMGASGMDSRAFGGGSTLGPNLFAAAAELQNLSRIGNQNSGSSPQMPLVDTVHLEYMRSAEFAAAQLAALSDQTIARDALASSYMELFGLHKAYLGTLLSSQKSHYGLSLLDKSGLVNHGYFENPSFGPAMSYPGSPLGCPFLPNSHIGSGSFLRHNEQKMPFPSGIRNLSGGVMGSWYSESGTNFDESFVPSFLDEFKNNKTKYFELAEIAGHVVECSSDQFGSRFIQQKLETASTEEKNMVFNEIMPQALSLMTDVFGNYVIQKFLEHGTPAQIRELTDQLIGHVLMLSLQMYGCRVIQKAIEVVDLDQKTKMVVELDGHVMRCVRDQNGNHVIQKCIECVPEDDIQFIVSIFYDQVVALSTHPYGCRVIQRVLEHCHSPKTQSIMMTEILKSVCMLAQDQYGNYVVQHVLQHGKPHERSAIINKLIVQIVQMSQQKFASNVVEKCLTYGTPEERKTLVNEMLGSTDENEPLQVMMKDQFANYVVQKVLETCDDQQLELILNRIKVHLNALKKYTYGKHIVARVEKLVAAGERRIGVLNSA